MPHIIAFILQQFSCDRTLTSARTWCDEAGGVSWSPLIGQDYSDSLDQSDAGICGLHIAEVSPGHRGHWSAALIGQVRLNKYAKNHTYKRILT